nr:MAG TPA: hypothetical protein [Caudoviricetes sp.]
MNVMQQRWRNGFTMLSNQEGEHGRRNNLSRVYRQGNQGASYAYRNAPCI